MGRSLKKGPFVDEKLLRKIKNWENKKTPIRTWSRDSTIIPEMLDFIFAVHNGKEFIPVKVIEEMVGHHLGEFAPTRRFRKHGGKIARGEEKTSSAKGRISPSK